MLLNSELPVFDIWNWRFLFIFITRHVATLTASLYYLICMKGIKMLIHSQCIKFIIAS